MGEERAPSAQGEFSLDPEIKGRMMEKSIYRSTYSDLYLFLMYYEPSRLPFPNQSYGAYMASNFIFITTFSDKGSLSSNMLNVAPCVASHLEVGQLIFLLPNTPTPITMVPLNLSEVKSPSDLDPIPYHLWMPTFLLSHTSCLQMPIYFPIPISWVKTDFFRTETDEQKEGEKRNEGEKKRTKNKTYAENHISAMWILKL